MGIKVQIPQHIPLTGEDQSRIQTYLEYASAVPALADFAISQKGFVPGEFAIVVALGDFGPYLKKHYPDLTHATGGVAVGNSVLFPLTLTELKASITESGFESWTGAVPAGFVLVVILDYIGYTLVFTELQSKRVVH